MPSHPDDEQANVMQTFSCSAVGWQSLSDSSYAGNSAPGRNFALARQNGGRHNSNTPKHFIAKPVNPDPLISLMRVWLFR